MSHRCGALVIAWMTVLGVMIAPAGAQEGPWVEPVDAPIVDGFRPPEHIGAPGNRGWEYQTVPGSLVGAAHDGVVVFAGAIGDSLYVSVQHLDGRRTTYSYLASVSVAVGDRVGPGSTLGTTGERFHFGVRLGAEYLDPGTLFTVGASSGDGSLGEGVRLVRYTPAARQAIGAWLWGRLASW